MPDKNGSYANEYLRIIRGVLQTPLSKKEFLNSASLIIETILPAVALVFFQLIILVRFGLSWPALGMLVIAGAWVVLSFSMGLFYYGIKGFRFCVKTIADFPESTRLIQVTESNLTADDAKIGEFISMFYHYENRKTSPKPLIYELKGRPRLIYRAYQFIPYNFPCILILDRQPSDLTGLGKFFLWHELAHSHDFLIFEDSLRSFFPSFLFGFTALITFQQPLSPNGIVVVLVLWLICVCILFLNRYLESKALLQEEISADAFSISQLDFNDINDCETMLQYSPLVDPNLTKAQCDKRNTICLENLNKWRETIVLSDGNIHPEHAGMLKTGFHAVKIFRLDSWALVALAVAFSLATNEPTYAALAVESLVLGSFLVYVLKLHSEEERLKKVLCEILEQRTALQEVS